LAQFFFIWPIQTRRIWPSESIRPYANSLKPTTSCPYWQI